MPTDLYVFKPLATAAYLYSLCLLHASKYTEDISVQLHFVKGLYSLSVPFCWAYLCEKPDQIF